MTRIACVLSAAELSADPIDVVLFPEGIDYPELRLAADAHPEAIIVGAVASDEYSKAIVLYKNENHISYRKVQSDGRTRGSNDLAQQPIAEFPHLSIGVLICMDVDCIPFADDVLDGLRRTDVPIKILCVPGDMGDYWFQGEILSFPQRFAGIHVALCNHTVTHNCRCKSFITDLQGNKIQTQKEVEPIFASL